jgi:alkylated DNA repair dioxygenase AlkB
MKSSKYYHASNGTCACQFPCTGGTRVEHAAKPSLSSAHDHAWLEKGLWIIFYAMARPQPKNDLPSLFDAGSIWPEGFRCELDLFSETDEERFVKCFEALPFKPFEFHGYLGNRRIVPFGYRYDYAGRALRAAEPMPEFLEELKHIVSRFTGIAMSLWEQALVTEYRPGAGIGWHRDKPLFADVAALSFLACCALRLRRKNGTSWSRTSVHVPPRSGYLLHGPVRDEWEHSIAPMNELRYSVTFRSFRDNFRTTPSG